MKNPIKSFLKDWNNINRFQKIEFCIWMVIMFGIFICGILQVKLPQGLFAEVAAIILLGMVVLRICTWKMTQRLKPPEDTRKEIEEMCNGN